MDIESARSLARSIAKKSNLSVDGLSDGQFIKIMESKGYELARNGNSAAANTLFIAVAGLVIRDDRGGLRPVVKVVT